eukprot:scaffold25778_cov129-Isochrysis_galbana.AAC.2
MAMSVPMKKAVKKIAERAIDNAIPDTVITTHKAITSDSAITPGDVGYRQAPYTRTTHKPRNVVPHVGCCYAGSAHMLRTLHAAVRCIAPIAN